MATTEEILNAYLVQDGDIPDEAHYPQHIPTRQGFVTPLVEGSTYFSQLDGLIQSVGNGTADENANEGIYIASWALDPMVSLGGPGSPTLAERLAVKAAAGVDVRILVWANDFVMEPAFPAAQMLDLTASFLGTRPHETQQTINLHGVENQLRAAEVGGVRVLEDRVVINTLDNPVGGCHMKFALVFGADWATGFTGGIDPMPNRRADDRHVVRPFHVLPVDEVSGEPVHNFWHDVQAKVEGPITDELFDHFRNTWNENLARRDAGRNPRFRWSAETTTGLVFGDVEAVTPGATAIPADKSIGVTPGSDDHWVQSLRTVPKTRFLLWKEPDISFAPDGVYEIELAVKKAILAARKYVYIEDQAMLSREIFDTLQTALTRQPEDGTTNDLKVILVTGVSDPADPPRDSMAMLYLSMLAGLDDEQRGRVVYYNHNQATIHSKVFLVDDVVAIIGSAGMFNRALYTEWEHAVAFVDSGGTAVPELRKRLWGEVFGLPDGERGLGTLGQALAMWRPGWGTGTPIGRLPRDVDRLDELWNGTWTFDGPVLAVTGKPTAAGGGPGQYPSLTDMFLIAEADPTTGEQLVLDMAPDPADPSTTVPMRIFRDAELRRHAVLIGDGTVHMVGPDGVPDPGLLELVDGDSIQSDWIPDPDLKSPGQVRLIGGFVVCTDGPNAGHFRRIVEQEAGRIGFEPFPHAIDTTFRYRITIAAVERVDLPDWTTVFTGWWEYLMQMVIADIGSPDFFAGPRSWNRIELAASVGADGVNTTADVLAVQSRLAQLGMDWVRIDGDAGSQTVGAIRLFQAMVSGAEVVGPGRQDGRVDVHGETIKWLNAANAPRWGLLPTGGAALGFTNRDITAQPNDRYDWGASWMGEVIAAAGASYRNDWLVSNPGAALLTVNDVSLPQGGNNTDHAGHEAGMQADISLPRTDGGVAGTNVGDTAVYDRDAMRAMLVALHGTGRVREAFLQDPVLIGEGLCTDEPDHADHLHIGLEPPARVESTAPEPPDPFTVEAVLGPPDGDHAISPASDRLLAVSLTIGDEDNTGPASETRVTVRGSGGVLVEEVHTGDLVDVGVDHVWTWDGRNRSGTVDMAALAGSTVSIRVAVTKNDRVVATTLDVAFEATTPWTTARVDHAARAVAIEVFVDCQNESGLSASQFAHLRALTLNGISRLWSRTIQLGGQPYVVTTTTIPRVDDSEDLDLYVENGPGYVRSHNSGIIDASIFYNAGFFSTAAAADDDFEITAAHEFGHSVLWAHGGKELSWGHKGSVNHSLLAIWDFQDPSPSATTHPTTGEIDLMQYYTDHEPPDYGARVIAAEEDVVRLLQLAAVTAHSTS